MLYINKKSILENLLLPLLLADFRVLWAMEADKKKNYSEPFYELSDLPHGIKFPNSIWLQRMKLV